jgi:hypothetical protein
MCRRVQSRLRDLLAVSLVLLAVSPFTAPFSTCDLTDHHTVTDKAEVLAGKLAADEGVVVVGAPPEAESASPMFVLVAGPAVADEVSKHQIPSRILRL